MTPRFMTLIPFCAALVVSGCATTDPLTLPELTLVDMRLLDVTLFETTAEIKVRISNPEMEPLILEGGVMRLSIDGIRAGSGMFDGPVEIPRLSTGTVDVVLHVSNVALASRLRAVVEDESFRYRLRSILYRSKPSGVYRVRVSKEGYVDFRGEDYLEPLN